MQLRRIVTQEQHELFAAGLLLILPDIEDMTSEIIRLAKTGRYDQSPTGLEDHWPSTIGILYDHLRPAIQELWRAVYRAK